jgi:hypothetical protein
VNSNVKKLKNVRVIKKEEEEESKKRKHLEDKNE